MHDLNYLIQKYESIDEKLELEFQILEHILISSLKDIYEDDPEDITVDHVHEMKDMFLSLIHHLQLLHSAKYDLALFADFYACKRTGFEDNSTTSTKEGQQL